MKSYAHHFFFFTLLLTLFSSCQEESFDYSKNTLDSELAQNRSNKIEINKVNIIDGLGKIKLKSKQNIPMWN